MESKMIGIGESSSGDIWKLEKVQIDEFDDNKIKNLESSFKDEES